MLTLSDKRTRTALVLGAGGIVGEAYEAGALTAMHESLGWDPATADLIVGTSAGSLVGTLLRCGLAVKDLYAYETNRPVSPPAKRLLASIVADWPAPRMPGRPHFPSRSLLLRAMRHPWGSRAGLVCAALPVGRMDTSPYADRLRILTGDAWPDQKLWIVAAKLPTGRRVVFGTPSCPPCDVPLAVSASCAIPGIFAPVQIDGSTYVDGGVHSPTNADLVMREDVDTVVVISPMSATRPSIRRIRVSPMRMFCRALLATEVRRLRAAGKRVVVVQPGVAEQRIMGVNGLDPSRCARVAQVARESVLERLERPRLREATARFAA
jgi:NTE family protein